MTETNPARIIKCFEEKRRAYGLLLQILRELKIKLTEEDPDESDTYFRLISEERATKTKGYEAKVYLRTPGPKSDTSDGPDFALMLYHVEDLRALFINIDFTNTDNGEGPPEWYLSRDTFGAKEGHSTEGDNIPYSGPMPILDIQMTAQSVDATLTEDEALRLVKQLIQFYMSV